LDADPAGVQPPPSFLPARSESGPRTPTRTGAKSTRGELTRFATNGDATSRRPQSSCPVCSPEDPSASLKRGFGLTGRLLPRPCPGNPLNPDWEGASNRGFHRLLTKPTAHPRLRLWARPLRGPGGWGGDWYVWHAPDGLRARAATGLGCMQAGAGKLGVIEASYASAIIGVLNPVSSH